MTFQELEPALLSLSAADRIKAIQALAKSLDSPLKGIESTSGVCGGDARIIDTRIPVWVLVEAKANGYSDADLLTSYPTLTATSLADAWAYAEAFSGEIEQAIQRNEAA